MGPLLFRAEDRENRQVSRIVVYAASMGPLLFRAEDLDMRNHPGRERKRLQWGRSCSERKTISSPGKVETVASFNGAALVQSGRHHRRRHQGPPRNCFNGAALVQSGRHPVREVVGSLAEAGLQWGRSCSERKTGRSVRHGRHAGGFNGAALVQSGRPCSGCCSNCFGCCSLQWGRSCSERKTIRHEIVPSLT